MSKVDWPTIKEHSQHYGSKAKEYSQLLGLNFYVRLKNFFEYVRVVFKYYGRLAFAKVDSYITLSYLFNNPFKISKRFLLSKGECDVHTYGETPLTTLDKIALECRLTANDRVFELGCGRGRTCFWLHEFIGCSVVGIDHVPEFIERANEVKKKYDVKGVEFQLEDILKADLKGATAIYIYGSCYSEDFIQRLAEKLSTLPSGAKVITVSYPLTEFAPKAPFEVMNRFPARFTWGTADVYLQLKK